MICPLFKYDNHPAGQQVIDNAKTMKHKEDQYLLFLSSHLHVDYTKLKAMCDKKGIVAPKDSQRFSELNAVLYRICEQHKHAVQLHEFFSLIVGLLILPSSILYRIYNPHDWTNVVLMMASIVYYSFNVFHMRHHRGFLFNKHIYDRVSFVFDIIDNLFMREPSQWINNHQLSHHIYTNLDDDYDYFSKYPVIRYDVVQPKLWFHNYQHIYVLMLYCVSEILRLLDKLPIRGRRVSVIIKNCICFIVHYTLMIYLPHFISGISLYHAILLYIMCYILLSLMLALLFQVSHNHADMNHIMDKTTKITSFDQFIDAQMKESVSWGGLWSSIMFGGINYQTEHHLAPACSPIALHYFHFYLKKNYKQYNYVPTFADACLNLYRNLKKQ